MVRLGFSMGLVDQREGFVQDLVMSERTKVGLLPAGNRTTTTFYK